MQEIQVSVEEKQRVKDKFILRFHSEGQRAEIKARAASNKRSMNAEVLMLIEAGIANMNRVSA